MAVKTFLELCQQLVEDAGISGSIVSTEGQSGEFKRVVGWIARATTEIEGLWSNWNFLHRFHTVPMIAGVRDYPPPPLLGMWDRSTFVNVAQESPIEYMDWNRKKLDPTAPVAGDPFMVTVLPAQTLRFYDTPTIVEDISAQYWEKPAILIASSDEPKIPEHFRDIIVYKALQYYANYESADEAKIAGVEQYAPRLRQLESSELPGHQNSGSINTGTDVQVVAPSSVFEDF